MTVNANDMEQLTSSGEYSQINDGTYKVTVNDSNIKEDGSVSLKLEILSEGEFKSRKFFLNYNLLSDVVMITDKTGKIWTVGNVHISEARKLIKIIASQNTTKNKIVELAKKETFDSYTAMAYEFLDINNIKDYIFDLEIAGKPYVSKTSGKPGVNYRTNIRAQVLKEADEILNKIEVKKQDPNFVEDLNQSEIPF